MIDKKKIAAVIVSAGSGQRMKSSVNKPLIEIRGKKILEMTLDKITSIKKIDKIILVIRKLDEENILDLIKKYDKEIKLVYGKDTREESTLEGLLALTDDYEFVITHDGVRPFASIDLFERVIDALSNYKAVIAATKVKDTIKIANSSMHVVETPNRDFLYNIQTPQAYDRKLLIDLYQKYINSSKKITDDSQLFEIFTKEKVKLVQGEYKNIKITTPEDIIFAKAIMEDL